MRRIRETIVAVEKQYVLHILSVSVDMASLFAILQSHLNSGDFFYQEKTRREVSVKISASSNAQT
jgi:hypothetical protein